MADKAMREGGRTVHLKGEIERDGDSVRGKGNYTGTELAIVVIVALLAPVFVIWLSETLVDLIFFLFTFLVSLLLYFTCREWR